MLDAFDGLPGVALVPKPVEWLGHHAQLDDEVAGQVLRLNLAPFLAPEPDESGFIVAHDDPGVGATDEALTLRCSANICKTSREFRHVILQ
jgi:hypothetical protein